ncbi:MAG: metal-dependent hydrolase [Halobacteriales archaeon]
MWPWGHAAVAYLVYSGLRRAAGRPAPSTVGALAVALGAQASDVIDKPLAWTFAVLESGRSLGHSLFVIVPAVALLWWVLGDDHPVAVAGFGVGWLSHPFADAVYSVAVWEPASLAYFVWPLAEMPPPSIGQSFLAHLLALEPDPLFLLEWLLVAAALVVWRADGYPGLAAVRARVEAPLRVLGE